MQPTRDPLDHPVRLGGRPKAALVVSAEDRETLELWTGRRKAAPAVAVRLRIVLRCATGVNQR